MIDRASTIWEGNPALEPFLVPIDALPTGTVVKITAESMIRDSGG